MIKPEIISPYINDLKPRVKKISVSNNNEESLRPVFLELLNRVGDHKNLWVVAEDRIKNNKKPDASIKNLYTIHGYYESKSPTTNLEKEIEIKLKEGYPTNNIIFENKKNCVLYQDNEIKKEIKKKNIWDDPTALSELLSLFFNYESEDIKKFKKAQTDFNKNLPDLANEIKKELKKIRNNQKYLEKVDEFVLECQSFINPYFNRDNVEAWLIQHILTEQIFLKVFDEQQYHKSNNISKTISNIETEFLLDVKKKILKKINPYMAPITNYGNQIKDLNEQQLFLKKVYQDFYNSYNKYKAEKLGIIYTPNEIVKFMVKSTEQIVKEYFNKELKDKNVHILDPATGTGTFITELIDHIYHQSDKKTLEYKYQNEIHANEVSVLPYYVANLSIEYTYEKLMNKTKPFPNLLLVDSLQNCSFKGQLTLDGLLFEKNQKRVKSQNKKEIKIVIGNPPYNQNDKRFNSEAIKTKYPEIEQRIKETYGVIKSQKEKLLQDKYIQFLRWATDRIDDNGIISFIINRSFLDAKSGEGLRACLEKEFNHIYIIDLGGNIRRKDPTDSNVFDIQAGVSIVFFIKTKEKNVNAEIKYIKLSEILLKDKKSYKLAELNQKHVFNYIPKFKTIVPNEKHQWLNQETEFNGLRINDIFEKSLYGILTARDEDVFDSCKNNLQKKIKFSIKDLRENHHNPTKITKITKIKLSGDLKRKIKKGQTKDIEFNEDKICSVFYRKNDLRYYYSDKILSDRLTNDYFKIYGENLKNNELALCYSVFPENKLKSDLILRPATSDYFGIQSGSPIRICAYAFLKRDVVDIFFKKYKLKLNKKDIFSYIIGIFHSEKYKNFILSSNFDKKNLPVPYWSDENYIKQGELVIKKQIAQLKKEQN